LRLMPTPPHPPRVLLKDPKNVLDQRVTQEWRHEARAEPRRAFHPDIAVDLVRIRRRRSTYSASQTILTTVLLHPRVQRNFRHLPSLLYSTNIPSSRITTWLLLIVIC
jgi:hypothetical protein